LADAACEGILDDNSKKHVNDMMLEIKNMKIHHYEIDVEDVLKEILIVNDYVWTKNGIPLINNLQSLREVVRRDEYLRRRDM